MKRFVITDLRKPDGISHCTGCFGCFFKDPGRCVIDDEYRYQGEKIGHCEEMIIISKLTFGGYSRDAKIQLDRCLPYTHADFHMYKGQLHHKNRYTNDPVLKVYFYGEGTDGEKKTAEKLVERNSYNMTLSEYEVYFCDTKEEAISLSGIKEGEF